MVEILGWLRSREGEHISDEQMVGMIDRELPSKDLARATRHVEQCWKCRARYQQLERTILEFVDYRDRLAGPLGPPGSGGEERLAVRLNALDGETVPHASGGIGQRTMRRLVWATAALVMGIPAVIALLMVPRAAVSADAILHEANQRRQAWLYQPNKVLRWVVESDMVNNPRHPDGHYRSIHWRNNFPGQTAGLIRRYSSAGQLVWARWDRPDGSEVVFDHFKSDLVSIHPSVEAVREFANTADPATRQRAENWLARRASQADLELDFQSSMDSFRRSLADGRLSVIYTREMGKVYRVQLSAQLSKGTEHVALERDFEAVTLRLIRLSSRHTPRDGKVYTEEDQIGQYAEVSLQDFEHSDLRDVLAGASHVVEISPLEEVRR
jgi:hypothetical protein